jgi:hypothetical protein
MGSPDGFEGNLEIDGLVGAIREGDAPGRWVSVPTEPGMPEPHLIGPRGETPEARDSVGGGLLEVRSLDDVDITQHPVMDVAAKDDDSRLIEPHRRGRGALVEG